MARKLSWNQSLQRKGSDEGKGGRAGGAMGQEKHLIGGFRGNREIKDGQRG